MMDRRSVLSAKKGETRALERWQALNSIASLMNINWRTQYISLKHRHSWAKDLNRKMNVSFEAFFRSFTPKGGHSYYGIWWFSVMDVLVSEWLKRKTSNFRLRSVAEESLCLVSSITKYYFFSSQCTKEPPVNSKRSNWEFKTTGCS